MYMEVSTLTFTWSKSQDARDTSSQMVKRRGEDFLFVILSLQGFWVSIVNLISLVYVCKFLLDRV